MRAVGAVLIALGLVLGGCRSPNSGPPTERVRFGSHSLAVEVADDKAEWGTGLMHRPRLARNAGMLFEFTVLAPAYHGFIMENVLIPLSIAFLRQVNQSEYQVVAVLEMLPCPPGAKTDTTPDCRSYPPGAPYDAAVEANRGWFSRAGVEVGDRATVEPFTR
jgi:uncharacterized membrane protein (UPF0127 family)